MENVINLSTKSADAIADLLKSLTKTGIAYNVYMEIPGDPKTRPLKKFEQIEMFEGASHPENFHVPAPKKKRATGNRPSRAPRKAGLLDSIISVMIPGEQYLSYDVAKALFKEYGVRGQKKPAFIKSVRNFFSRYTDKFVAEKIEGQKTILYSLKKSENENA